MQQMNAQDLCSYRLSGTVKDAVSGETLPLALIEMEDASRHTLSDSSGTFVLDSLCTVSVRIRVRYVGYDSTNVLASVNKPLVIRLNPNSTSLKAANIVSKRVEATSLQSSDTIGAEGLTAKSGLGLTDLLQTLTGVTALQSGSTVSKPVIHGLHSQRILIMNAGVRQEGQQWGSEHAPEIDPFIAGKLTVIRGASVLRYGADALGGVILVEPRELPHEPGINAELNLIGISNGRQGVVSGMVEQHLGKLYDICWRIQGTAKRGGNIQTPEVYLDNTGVSEYNWSFSAGIERKKSSLELFYSSFKGKFGIFSGSHIGNLSDLQRIIDSGETLTSDTFSYEISKPRQEVLHRLLSVRSWVLLPGFGKLTGRYGYQYNRRYEYDRDKPYNDSLSALNIPDLELQLFTHTADLNIETYSFHGFTGIAGINGMIQDNQYGGLRFFVPNYKLMNVGSYFLLRKKVKALEFEAAVRYDARAQTVYRNISGQVVSDDYQFSIPNYSAGILYRPDSVWTSRLFVGSAKRAPSINEWFSDGLHHGTATYERGDPSLGIEQAWTVNAGLRMDKNSIALDATLFYMFIADYIYLVPDNNPVLTISGAFPSFVYKHVDASFSGADLDFSWRISSRLEFRSRNSVVFARNQSADQYLELVPSPRFVQSLNYAFKNAGYWHDIQVGATNLFVTEQWRYNDGSDYIPPPPSYSLLSIEASAIRSINKSDIRFGLTISNLFNVRYRDYMNRLRYYSDEPGRSFIFRLNIPLHFVTKAHNHVHD